MRVHREAAVAPHRCTGSATMLVDVCQKRKAERDSVFEWAAGPRMSASRLQDVANAALEQIVFVAKVRVELRLNDVGATENLLHGDLGIRLFAREANEGVV